MILTTFYKYLKNDFIKKQKNENGIYISPAIFHILSGKMIQIVQQYQSIKQLTLISHYLRK